MMDEQQQNATGHSKYSTWQRLTSWNDELYLGKVFVGTPEQLFFLSMDTGSSTMWIIDGACDSPICNGYPDSGRQKYKFHYDNSTTFLHTNSNFAFNYGTRWAGGFIGRDTVALGKLTIWHGQQFGVANSLAPFFGTVPIDGVFGLGWNEFDNMRAPISMLSRYLDSKQFTVWMNRSATDKQGQVGGYITYGGYDDIHCDKNMFYAPLAMDNKWAVDIESFEIDH
ncbi:eukaryotic aspartyl protease [Ancylostoma duodenale]|uniref:Eukaryotic aspartyl protease n=1 Tax=Ancylostoma duodenale TaxID=51022 RepID=A0A0C2GA46_9BILA|nr:eukaryotic aspartyl protease [Ancylostoma duodenale]